MNRKRAPAPYPFTDGHDQSLYVETERLRSARLKAVDLISKGAGLWVKGPPGSGRTSFVSNLAHHLESEGLFAVLVGPGNGPIALGVIGRLYRALCPLPLPAVYIEACEAVYAGLLKNIWRGRNVVLFADPYGAAPSFADELELLTELGFMGKPLASVVCCGEGDPPLQAMAVLELDAPGPGEMAEILKRRMELTGTAGFSPTEIAALAENAGCFSSLVAGACAAFRLRVSDQRLETEPPPPANGSKSDVLPREMIEEVGRLLEAISLDGSAGSEEGQ